MPSSWIQTVPKLGTTFAIQWDGADATLVLLRAAGVGFTVDESVSPRRLHVLRPDGERIDVGPNDYLVRGSDGRHRAYSATDFATAFTAGLPVNPNDPGGPGGR